MKRSSPLPRSKAKKKNTRKKRSRNELSAAKIKEEEEEQLRSAATRIQSLFRGAQTRTTTKLQRQQSIYERKVGEHRRRRKSVDAATFQDVATVDAATRIQSIWRGKQVRKTRNFHRGTTRSWFEQDLSFAAVRGSHNRGVLGPLLEEEFSEDAEERLSIPVWSRRDDASGRRWRKVIIDD